ncbi:ferric reductase-like transmembrane domain-containing protein [Methanospirillum hungatei]|uniref:ferric reductase-like transmembrane domain-containing protein n=1 Tax=Methanospirillum hungatei TaxID=2203 RepID=UPI0026F0EA03|nr:ferric reductase-like transmembrane domain-containing protein [Methanospirillum hungatei]MCA1916589.1 ferric reductase-like transmembrane domain-containing protein [Methanospirillum hungatei]
MDESAGIIRVWDDIHYMHFQRRFLLLLGILVLYGIPLLVIAGQETSWSFYTLLRIAGIWGFISLSLGALLNLKKGVVKSQFGRPFIRIHHYFAISGLILVTIHPVLYAYLALDPGVFIPDFSSLHAFFATGGRTALILLYLAFCAGLVRMALKNRWRYIHILVYPALIIAAVHANLIGQTMTHPLIYLIINGLVLSVCCTFVYIRVHKRDRHSKRYRTDR